MKLLCGRECHYFLPIFSTNHLGVFWNIFFAIVYENLWYIFWVKKVFNCVTNEWNQPFCVSTSPSNSQLAFSFHSYPFHVSHSKVKVLFASCDSSRVSVTFFSELYTTYIMTLCIECTTLIQPKIVSRLTFFWTGQWSTVGGGKRVKTPLWEVLRENISRPKARLYGFGWAVFETTEAAQFLSSNWVILLVIIFNCHKIWKIINWFYD